jgi:uncharacterized membrane protein YhhN
MMAVLYIFIIPNEPLIVKVIFKLIPMVLIIVYAFKQFSSRPNASQRLILTGLFFCMLGDWFITLSFIAGLGAFLVGHLFYLSGFFKAARTKKDLFVTLFLIGIYAFSIGNQLISSLLEEGLNQLIIPVIVYMLVISLMALSAIRTRNMTAAVGSVLFVLSDSILSWSLFVTSFAYSEVLIMTTYYLAQFLIASSLSTITRNPRHSESILKSSF